MSYGPPELYSSDSEDEWMYGGDYDENGERIRFEQPAPIVNSENEIAQKLYRFTQTGDVANFRELWESNRDKLDVNAPIRNHSWTPLMYACDEGHVDLVKYLLFQLNADPNAHSSDWSALILACRCSSTNLFHDLRAIESDESNALQICQWLLQFNAMINQANLQRETPLMHAAASGFQSVIVWLLQNNSALEAKNNDDETALFYAVRHNQFNATKTLIEAGAIVEMQNCYAETPKSIAQNENFDHILELFPPDPIYNFIPSHLTYYDTYMDLIPTAFPEREAPAYSPDVYTMLAGMRASAVEYKFYEAGISLPEMLTITENRLREIGIEFPYHRDRILYGLLQFHEKSWNRNSLSIPTENANIQDYFNMFSNCLRQLIVMESSLKFIQHHPIFANIETTTEYQRIHNEIKHQLQILYKNIIAFRNSIQKLETLAPPPPIYICQNVIRNVLNQKKTFQAQIYRNMKIAGCVAIGIATFALVRARTR